MDKTDQALANLLNFICILVIVCAPAIIWTAYHLALRS